MDALIHRSCKIGVRRHRIPNALQARLRKLMSSSTTDAGPVGTISGLGRPSLLNSILSLQTLRRKSENTSMVSSSPGQRR